MHGLQYDKLRTVYFLKKIVMSNTRRRVAKEEERRRKNFRKKIVNLFNNDHDKKLKILQS